VAQGGDAYVTPYTLLFPHGDGFIAADLDDPSALPRVGDIVEYIDERGAMSRFHVQEVIHTVQSSAAHRPAVADEVASPNAIARSDEDDAEAPGSSGLVRAGLPQVVLAAID
jgi:hypothetical protein